MLGPPLIRASQLGLSGVRLILIYESQYDEASALHHSARQRY